MMFGRADDGGLAAAANLSFRGAVLPSPIIGDDLERTMAMPMRCNRLILFSPWPFPNAAPGLWRQPGDRAAGASGVPRGGQGMSNGAGSDGHAISIGRARDWA